MTRISLLALMILCCASMLFGQVDTVAPPASLSLPPASSTEREIILWGGLSFGYLPAEFSRYWKSGWNGAIGYGLSFEPGAMGYGAVAVVVEYSRYPFDESGYRTAMTEQFPGQAGAIRNAILTARGSARTLSAMLQFKGSFSATKRSAAPYFLVGVGYLRFASDSIALQGLGALTVPENSQSGLAWTFGLGLELPLTERLGMFVQIRSVIGALDRTRQYFPLSGGVRMTL